MILDGATAPSAVHCSRAPAEGFHRCSIDTRKASLSTVMLTTASADAQTGHRIRTDLRRHSF